MIEAVHNGKPDCVAAIVDCVKHWPESQRNAVLNQADENGHSATKIASDNGLKNCLSPLKTSQATFYPFFEKNENANIEDHIPNKKG